MRNLTRALTAGLLVAAALLGAATAADAATGTGSVSGVVVDHAGRPVVGVTVTVLATAATPASAPVTTGADGGFVVGAVDPGARVVEVAGATPGPGLPYPDFVWTERMAFPVTVLDGTPTEVRLAVGQGTVRGTISVNGGAPPLTASIEAVNQYGDRFGSILGIAPYTMPLPVGVWDLTVTGTAPGTTITPVTLSGVVVAAGQITNLDVSLPGTTYAGPTWVGLVTDPGGQPVPDVQIVGTGNGVTGPDGRYGLELDPQQPAINFDADFIPPASTGLAIVHAGAAPVGTRPYVVDVVLPRAGAVAGTVLDPSGAPAVGATVSVLAGGNGPLRTTTTAPDGTFRIDQLVPGPRTLVASLPGQPPASQAVTVTSGETATVSVPLATGAIAGQVTRAGGLAFVNGSVTAVGEVDQIRHTTAFGPDGQFRLDLTGQRYQVSFSVSYVDPVLGYQVATTPDQSIDVLPGQTTTVDPIVPDPPDYPPPVIPEAPVSALLPLLAVLTLGASTLHRRHRLSHA